MTVHLTASDVIALLALFVSVLTLIVYTVQLIVLILGYFRIIKDTNENARERQKALDGIGNKLQSVVDGFTQKFKSWQRNIFVGLFLTWLAILLLAVADIFFSNMFSGRRHG